MPSRRLIEALRVTLQQLERDQRLNPNDSTLAELKRCILHTLADLERSHSDGSGKLDRG